MPKTNAETQREWRERMKANGYVRSTFWIKPEWAAEIKALIEKLNNKTPLGEGE